MIRIFIIPINGHTIGANKLHTLIIVIGGNYTYIYILKYNVSIINILIIILYLDLQKPMATRNEQTITKPVQTHLSYPPHPTLPQN
jgi:hypothetical protein